VQQGRCSRVGAAGWYLQSSCRGFLSTPYSLLKVLICEAMRLCRAICSSLNGGQKCRDTISVDMKRSLSGSEEDGPSPDAHREWIVSV
jgi:hypothetical protein